MKWRVVWAIAQKDIVEAVKNRYLFFSLILPIGLSLLFSVAFRVPEDLGVFKVAVYDPGGSRLVAALRGLSDVQVQEVGSAGALPEVVKKGAVAGLAVPAGFDAAVQVGEKPELAVCLNYRQRGREGGRFPTPAGETGVGPGRTGLFGPHRLHRRGSAGDGRR